MTDLVVAFVSFIFMLVLLCVFVLLPCAESSSSATAEPTVPTRLAVDVNRQSSVGAGLATFGRSQKALISTPPLSQSTGSWLGTHLSRRSTSERAGMRSPAPPSLCFTRTNDRL